MRIFSLSKTLKLITLISLIVLVGCESADVEPEHIAASGSSGGAPEAGGSPGDAITPGNNDTSEIDKTAVGQPFTDSDDKIYTKIEIKKTSETYISDGHYSTELYVTPISGYTFTWKISNTAVGKTNPETGLKTVYKTTKIPELNSIQTITVTGKSSNSPALSYRGRLKIPYTPPTS